MEGCEHKIHKSYRKRATEEFINFLRDSVKKKKKANYWLEWSFGITYLHTFI